MSNEQVEKLTCYIPNSIYEKLTIMSDILNKSQNAILEEAINSYAKPYENKYNKIKVLPAYLIIETKNGTQKEEPCFLLDKMSLDGIDYAKILYDNHISTVLFSQIKI